MMLYGGTYPDHICRQNKQILYKYKNLFYLAPQIQNPLFVLLQFEHYVYCMVGDFLL